MHELIMPDLAEPITSEMTTCSHCGALHPAAKLVEFEGETLCPDCLDDLTVVCSHCDDRIWRDDNAGDADTPLCAYCYDEHYTTCANCGAVIHRDDAYCRRGELYCYDCAVSCSLGDAIHEYDYKPTPRFYGDGPRYFGVELEIDGAGESDTNAGRVLNIANRENAHIYCKHDGSLDDGFEIVTHPMSYSYHMNEMPWPELLETASELGYLSHQAGTCGLHVHVSRKAFGATCEEQDAAIARVLYFFESHWNELLRFSRRTERQLEQWAARYGYKDSPKEILDHAKGGCGRYTCVNLYPPETIEFRIFRGTLKLNTLLATLQLVNHICDVALSFSDKEIKSLSWSTFVSGCSEPELIQYLKERRLYVNEPTESEEDL